MGDDATTERDGDWGDEVRVERADPRRPQSPFVVKVRVGRGGDDERPAPALLDPDDADDLAAAVRRATAECRRLNDALFG